MYEYLRNLYVLDLFRYKQIVDKFEHTNGFFLKLYKKVRNSYIALVEDYGYDMQKYPIIDIQMSMKKMKSSSKRKNKKTNAKADNKDLVS